MRRAAGLAARPYSTSATKSMSAIRPAWRTMNGGQFQTRFERRHLGSRDYTAGADRSSANLLRATLSAASRAKMRLRAASAVASKRSVGFFVQRAFCGRARRGAPSVPAHSA